MSIDPEQAIARREHIQNEISRVRGHAQTAGGAVVVETDLNGSITDLQISQSAMSVEPGRLAKAITQCHETAMQRAQDAAGKLFMELRNSPDLPTSKPAPSSQDWEEPTPIRITHTM